MSNTVITISYDGTAYSGFQIQANANTVQAELERALAVIYKEPVRINGAGRTDAGVHALGQVANFTAPFTIETDKLPHALNCLLPDDVVVTAAHEAGDGFHARFDTCRNLSILISSGLLPGFSKALMILKHFRQRARLLPTRLEQSIQ